jgi:phospholipid/cholesterol/gamma-HCH transport system ATP-binding protein
MQEHSQLSLDQLTNLASLKIAMAGLKPEAAFKYPAELSGGMIKRAAMARSIALDPSILFLDEPSAGLDPISASSLDQLILELRASLKLTIVMVTHDLDTLNAVADRIAFIGQGKVLACDSLKNLLQSTIPEVRDYFQNTRARRTFGGNGGE